MRSALATFFAVLCLVLPCGAAFAYTSPGSPNGYVNDFAGMLSADENTTLESTLKDFHDTNGGQIAVVTIATLGGDDIESYANTLFREWGIGDKDKNNGILLLIAKDDHKLRIEVGYGYEGILTDARSSEIIRNTITPYFKQEQYGLGVLSGVRDIITALTEGAISETTPPAGTSAFLSHINFGNLLFFIFFLLPWLASVFGRSKSWWAGGVVGAVLGGAISFFIGTIAFGIFVTGLLTALGLLFDFVVSRGYKNSMANGVTPPWWSGGNWGGGGNGGGGFGGFGGGSSGGGGASGSW